MKFLVVASILSMAEAFCHYGTTLAPRRNLQGRAADVVGYHTIEGPLNWHGLDAANSLCALGKNQSPINIDSTIKKQKGASFNFDVDSYPFGAELENLGSTVQVTLNGSVLVEDKHYDLVQFHFHTPSEHHLLGEHYPLEVHFVFQATDKSLAVVGFMIDVAGKFDCVSTSLSAALANMKDIPTLGDKVSTEPLDFKDLMAHVSKSEVYAYNGSLTTPPCTEGVKFNVVADPVYVDVSTFRDVRRIIKFNSRYTQNAPGHMNLLENAGKTLKGAV